MAVTKNHEALLKKLKAQVKLLQKKEEKSRTQLHTAFRKIQKIGKIYSNKIVRKVRLMQNKVMAAQASTYAKAASDLEQQILHKIKKKTLAIAAAIEKIEKMHAKTSSKQSKSKTKKTSKSSKSKPSI